MQEAEFCEQKVRKLERQVGKEIGIKIHCDSINPSILSFTAEILQEGAKRSYKDLMEITAAFLYSSSYGRQELNTLMIQLGVSDPIIQDDLLYMARSWHNRDTFILKRGAREMGNERRTGSAHKQRM